MEKMEDRKEDTSLDKERNDGSNEKRNVKGDEIKMTNRKVMEMKETIATTKC